MSFFDWGEEGAVSVAPLWWSTTHNARAAWDSPLSTRHSIAFSTFQTQSKSFKAGVLYHDTLAAGSTFNLN